MSDLPTRNEIAESMLRELDRVTAENIKLATALRYYAETGEDGGSLARAALGIPCSTV